MMDVEFRIKKSARLDSTSLNEPALSVDRSKREFSK